jgi:hypothetical protein
MFFIYWILGWFETCKQLLLEWILRVSLFLHLRRTERTPFSLLFEFLQECLNQFILSLSKSKKKNPENLMLVNEIKINY